MAVAIEGFSVVGHRQRIVDADGLSIEDLTALVPNATTLIDDDLWRCSFMAESDAAAFLGRMQDAGFNISEGPNSDFVLVNEFDLEVTPYCEWIEVAQYEKGVIAWKSGTVPKTIVARQDWTPEKGSGLTFGDRHKMDGLEFVRLDGSVEVYRDKATGELVYIGRTETPVEALYETSAKLILQHSTEQGRPPLRGKLKQEILASVNCLESVVSHHPDFWRAHYFIGKGYESVGELDKAQSAFQTAYVLDPEGENVCRALVANCLSTDRIELALEVCVREATSFPDDVETLGNLGLCYLLNQNLAAARKTIDAALRLDETDRVNLKVRSVIQSVESGDRPCPRTVGEIRGTAKSRSKSSLWQRITGFLKSK